MKRFLFGFALTFSLPACSEQATVLSPCSSGKHTCSPGDVFFVTVPNGMIAAGAASVALYVETSDCVFPPGMELVSDHPERLTVDTGHLDCDPGALLFAHAGVAGHVQLSATASDGTVLGTYDTDVVTPARLIPQLGWSGSAPAIVLEDAPQALYVTPVDSAGHPLIGSGLVSFSLTGPLTDVTVDPCTHPPDDPSGGGVGDIVVVEGTPGNAGISASLPNGPRLDIPLTVISSTAISSVQLAVGASGDQVGQLACASDGQTLLGASGVGVTATAIYQGGPVWGLRCSWKTSGNEEIVWKGGGWLGDGAPTAYGVIGTPGSTVSIQCNLGNVHSNVATIHL